MTESKGLLRGLFFGVLICIFSTGTQTASARVDNLSNYSPNPAAVQNIPDNRFYNLGLGIIESMNLTDKPYLIASGMIGTHVYDPDTLEEILSSNEELPVVFYGGSLGGIPAVAWSPDELTLALGASNGKLYLWNVQSYQPVRMIEFGEPDNFITGLAWSPDANMIAAQIMFDAISLWNIETGLNIQNFENHIYTTSSLDFSSHGNLLASVGDLNTSALVWNLESRELVDDFKKGHEHQWNVAFSPDSSMLAVGSDEGEVTIRNLNTGRVNRVLEGLPADVNSIYWSSNSDIVASSADLSGFNDIDATIPAVTDAVAIWDVQTGELEHLFENQTYVALRPDGNIMASVDSFDQILLQDFSSGALLQTLTAPENTFYLQWSFDGSIFASTNTVVTLWN